MFKVFFLVILLFESSLCAAPDIRNLPTLLSVSESQTASTAIADVLFTLDVSDPDNDTFSCIVSATSPSIPGAFIFQDDSGTFNFYLNNNPPFKFSVVNRYTVTCTCTDSNGDVSSGDITVNMTPNPRPAFQGMPDSASISVTASVGDKVADISVSDSNPFTCVIASQSPNTGSFYLSNVTNYQVIVAKTLTTGIYTINIDCCDDWGCSTGTLTTTVTPNPPPTMNGYPASVDVLESTTGGITIHTIDVTDDDAFGCELSPNPQPSAFLLDTASKKINLTTSHNLKYADQSMYSITINCSNANSFSTGVLTVNVLPNARPVITLFGTVTISESQTDRIKLHDVVVTETDPYACTGPASSRVSVESTGGTPAYAVYLVANADLSVNTFTADVNCSDDWGYDIKALTVTVLAKVPPTMSGFPVSESVVESVAGGKGIYTLQVNDSETFTCSGGSGPFSVLKLSGDWVIYLPSTHSLNAKTTDEYTFTVNCTNESGKWATGAVTINVLPNTPPDIQSAPFSGTVTYGETARRLLQTFVIVDAENDTFTCTLAGTGAGTLFSFPKESDEWRLYLNANPDFDNPKLPQYPLNVTCADDWGSSTGSITINMVANAYPVIDGLPTVVFIIESDAGGNSIYTVTVTDAEGDSISCLIDNVIPATASSAFTMIKPAADYQVQLVAGHTLRQETTPSVVITIKCLDANAVYANLTVTVQPNSPPQITSLTATGTYIAGTPGKVKIHDLVVTDAEGDNYGCTQTVTPTPVPGTFPFEYNTTSKAYEMYVAENPTLTASSYNLSITCSDDYGSSSKLFALTVTPNNNPMMSGFPATVTVIETETASRQLLPFTVTDPEGQTPVCSLVSTLPGPFSINQNLGIATPTYAVDLNVDAIDLLDGKAYPLHIINVTCVDPAGGTSSGLLYCQVTPNEEPVITGLQARVEVSENQKAELLIWTLAHSDPENDPVTCVCTVTPAGPFDFRQTAGGGAYTLYVQSGANFDHDTIDSYLATFTCTDHHSGRTGRSSNNSLTIDIIKNRTPVYTSANSTTRDAQNTAAGTKFFTCGTTDLDGDTVTYDVTFTPTTDSISVDPNTCEFTAIKDFKKELNRYYKATITASDGKATAIQNVGITLTKVNTAPELTSIGVNQKKTIYIPENTVTNSLLYTPVIVDPNTGQVISLTYTTFPVGNEGMFNVSTTEIRLKNGMTFDHEKIDYFKLTMYVNDGYAETGPYFLEIFVTDVPEVCGFKYTLYEATTTEAGQGGGKINIGLPDAIIDEDDPDFHTYSLVDNECSQYFDINSLSGEITFKINYDIDTCGSNVPNSLPRNCTVIVRCTDKHGLTGVATIFIHVNDYNDNTPIWPNGGVVMTTNQYSQDGNCIGTLNATDCDWDINAMLTYDDIADLSTDADFSPGSEYFTITGTGCVAAKNIDHYREKYGTTHKFRITATDGGNPRRTGTTELTIIHVKRTTTTTTTTQAPNTPTGWWDKVENLILVAVLSLLALFLLGLLAYMCCRRGPPCKSLPKCKECWKPKPPTRKVRTLNNPGKDPWKFHNANDNDNDRAYFSTKDMEGGTVIPNMKF